MNTGNIITLDNLGASPKAHSAGSRPQNTGGVSFRDVMTSLASARDAIPARVSSPAQSPAAAEVYVPADSPIIAAVKLLQKADGKTLSAISQLAEGFADDGISGTISLENTTTEELLTLLEKLGISDETAENVLNILNAFEEAGAADITPETVEIESSFAESVIGNAKSDLAEIAHTLYPDLYETAEDAAADAENFPVSIKLVPMVIVGEKGITVEIPAQMSDTDGLSLSTDEVMETAKILAELNANSLERIQNLLSGQNISIYEAVRALAAVPASATSPTDGVIGINVTEADFLSAESVLSRIAANNPNLQATETIALSDSNKAILEELQAIVKEVIIREAPPTTVSVSVNPLFESRFRERINKLYESTEPDYNDIKVGTTDEKVTFSTDKVDAADEISQSGSNSVRDNPFAAINIRPSAIPVSEIASQPAPFIGTGGEVAPEMQIGNRILEMNTDTDGIQEMTVVLRPRELGEVAVKIVTTAGEVTVTLSAASAETAKILDRNTALLSSQLQDGGVNVKDILTIAPSNASENMGLNFNGESFTSDGNGQGTNGGGNNGRALGEEPLPGEIDGEFTPDDFMQRRMSLWRSV